MKLFEIASGWFNFINASVEHKQMISYRLQVCDECSQKKQLSPMGKNIIEALNDEASIFYCEECHCPLAGKTAAPTAQCPLYKWLQWASPETHY